MTTYSEEQVRRYLAYVGLPASVFDEPPSVRGLEQLVSRQLATVPFESLSLHYSKTHRLSLEPADLYDKMVGHGRGGYCMENSTFFGVMLRSLGYSLIHTGGRVSNATAGIRDGGFMGL
jgi:arylamine N-acetyltransferase